jgi:hypothetical protein
MPNVVYATKAHAPSAAPKGVLVYMRTAQGNDALAWMDEAGKPVTQSQLTILKAAACSAPIRKRCRAPKSPHADQKGLAHIVKKKNPSAARLAAPRVRASSPSSGSNATGKAWATSAISSSQMTTFAASTGRWKKSTAFPLYQSPPTR